ncbi:TIGR02680 family protein [Paenibacillus allorhizosphaerae]|uniref:TIGR02680 family protein n=1 Tax=Paenibacillus allorhizosphaerae TaxID=2849866 RepID=A0ABM8VNL4_9BACL|nr:TIGR02680 family protein [Paenibacillus allorhizosphaerae]CAG7651671.1 hypothetical protein PAECIP111802_05022 [Paenibacillus allorhizosphaerae]
MNWRPTRAALIDFWVFDYEEFHFRDGKMLLRGGNGVGKSITMQTLLPVMLDGDISSKRLDPFGTRDKHMDYYVLFESKMEERTERNSYVLLEFEKPGQNRYITLGMGLNGKIGRKNGLDVWYFIVKDNRRYRIDFDVIRPRIALDGGEERVTYPKGDLRNKVLNTGTYHTDKKEEYAKEVNKLLFEFPTMDVFQNWIELLVQLRTPKLSNAKDMNFKAVYDILKKSMPALTDDDLRVLTESIQHIDNIQDDIKSSRQTVQSLERIDDVYRAYNRAVVGEKSKQYVDAVNRENDIRRRLANAKEELERIQENKRQVDEVVLELTTEERTLKAEFGGYNRERGVVSILEQLQQLSSDLDRKKINQKDKEKQYSDELSKKRSQIEARDAAESTLGEELESLEERFEKVTELAEQSAYMDHEYYAEPESPDFNAWIQNAQSYLDMLTRGKEKLADVKEKERRLQELKDERDEIQKEDDRVKEEIQHLREELISLQEDYMQVLSQWSLELQGLSLNEDDSKQMYSLAAAVSEDEDGFHPLKEWITQMIRRQEKGITEKKMELRQRMTNCDNYRIELSKELRRWQNLKDPEPQRKAGADAFRAALKEAGTPHAPLFALVDWKEHVSPEQRMDVESALSASGLLDALVAPTLAGGEIREDRVLQGAAHVAETGTLLEYVQIADHGLAISDEAIAKCLSAISVSGERDSHTVILLGKRYHTGALVGHAEQAEASYIGKVAREKIRQSKIETLRAQLSEADEAYKVLQQEQRMLKERMDRLQEEERRLPVPTVIMSRLKDIGLLQISLQFVEKQLEINQQNHSKAFTALTETRKELSQMRLSVNTIEACRKAIQFLGEYMDEVRQIQHRMSIIENKRAIILNLELRIKEIEDYIVDLLGEKNVLASEITKLEGEKVALQLQVNKIGGEQIKERISSIITRLDQLPQELKEQNDMSYKLKYQLERAEEKLQEEEGESVKRIELTQAAERILRDELALPLHDQPDTDIFTYAKAAAVGTMESSSHAYDHVTSVLMNERLLDYVFEFKTLFDNTNGLIAERRVIEAATGLKRVSPDEALREIREKLESLEMNLDGQEQKLFEDIIINTLGLTIREKIKKARRWIDGINAVMKRRKASISFRLDWKGKKAETSDEIDTLELVQLLTASSELMKEEDSEKITKHFRTQINRAREWTSENPTKKLQDALRDVLDYREWFDFKLDCYKEGKWHEVNRTFLNTASGGQRALSVYVPLFSALHACYEGANEDAARLVTLDEAFAGVDEKNIADMFGLAEEMEFSYILTSQVLWGDYPTVKSLSVAHIIKPETANFATIAHYNWDGVELVRHDVEEEEHRGFGEQLAFET